MRSTPGAMPAAAPASAAQAVPVEHKPRAGAALTKVSVVTRQDRFIPLQNALEQLGVTGLTNLVGETVAGMLGSNINPFILVFVFCVLTSVLATLTGSTIGTVLVFAPMAVATCVSLGWDPTAAASAIVVSGWCGHFLPIDGLPAMCMGLGNYTMKEFWKFTIPQYFIRLLALTAGALLLFPV